MSTDKTSQHKLLSWKIKSLLYIFCVFPLSHNKTLHNTIKQALFVHNNSQVSITPMHKILLNSLRISRHFYQHTPIMAKIGQK